MAERFQEGQQEVFLTESFSYFNYWRGQIDPHLERFFKSCEDNPLCEGEYGKGTLDRIAEMTLRGGKRQRVAFVAAAYSLFGGDTLSEREEQAIIDAAMGVEILQTHLLIHDDLIDEAPLRRGGETIHTFYQQEFHRSGYRGDSKKYGDSVALLAGDLTVYFACQPIIDSRVLSAESKIKILRILIQSGVDTFYGQLLDLLRDARGTTSEEEIIKLAYMKAGRSSGEAPMHIGAVLAGNDSREVLDKLSAYSNPLSVAFQFQDDILGLFGKEELLGKSTLSDLAEGKQTLLILKALERSNSIQRQALNNLVGKKDIAQEEADKVRQIVIETGALEYVRDVSRRYILEAQEALDNWNENWGSESKRFFWAVSEITLSRQY